MSGNKVGRGLAALALAVGVLLLPAASVSAQPSRSESLVHGVFFEPLRALDWLASVWQRLTGWEGTASAVAKSSHAGDHAAAADVCSDHQDHPCGPQVDEGPLVTPDG